MSEVVLAVLFVFSLVFLFGIRLYHIRSYRRIVGERLRQIKEENIPQKELVKPTAKTFEMSDQMSVSPQEAFAKRRHGWYFIPSFLGNSEKEEFLMRVLKPSLEAGKWVGIAWSSLVSQMIYEINSDRAGTLEERPFSVIFVVPPQNVLATVYFFKDEGLLRIEEIGNEQVLFPTQKLIEKLMG